MEKQTAILIKDFIEFGGAALLFVIMSLLTQQKWIGRTKFIVIIAGCILSGYFFSGIPAYFLPEMYNGSWRTFLNWATTVVSFMFLLYMFERKVFFEAFDYFKNKKLK